MRAIIYTRVSSDQTGQARSVESQERECRAVCEREGWDLADVLCDNDRGASRWSGKARPEYKKLAKVLKAGDVLVTWEASRAQRDLAAYVDLRDLCAERGVLWSYSGRVHNLAEGDDRFSTGLDALLAEREADQIRTRVLRGKRAAAFDGRPAGKPPFGYRRLINSETGRTDGWAIDEQAGPVVRDAVRRVLAGESLWSICRDLDARGVPGPQSQRNAASRWRAQHLRQMLSSPSYAGLRQHQGQVVGKGRWEALITEEDHQKLLALFADPARRLTTHRGSEPRHLLSGIARCGECREAMRWIAPKSEKKLPGYICSHRSCVRRRGDLVDLLVTETIIERLERPDAVALFAEQGNDEMADVLAHADTLKTRLAGFIDKAVAGEISNVSFAQIEAKLLPQIAAAEAKARSTVTSPLVAELAGADVREKWEALSTKDRRTVVQSLLDVKILRARRGNTRRFDPEDIEVTWRTPDHQPIAYSTGSSSG
jgi:site-specific DNA recombinase